MDSTVNLLMVNDCFHYSFYEMLIGTAATTQGCMACKLLIEINETKNEHCAFFLCSYHAFTKFDTQCQLLVLIS